MEYIYLLREREFIKTGEPVYKLGKTKQPNLTRFSQYPKGSELLLQAACTDCDTAEKELLRLYKNKFTQRSDIGSEYFAGNPREMIGMIHQYFTPPHTAIQEQVAITTSNKPANNSPKYIPKRNTNGDYTYIIDTYEKFTHVAATVSKIIITNKEKLTGWMLTKGGVWKRLKKYTAKTSNNEQKYYTLLGLIEQAYNNSVVFPDSTPEENSEHVCHEVLINWFPITRNRIRQSAYVNNAAATGYEIIGVVYHYGSREVLAHTEVLWNLNKLDGNVRPDPTEPINLEREYTWIPFTVDKNALLRDILEKCYNPDPMVDNLDYHILPVGTTSEYTVNYQILPEAFVFAPFCGMDPYSYDLDLRELETLYHYKDGLGTEYMSSAIYHDDLLKRKRSGRTIHTEVIVGRSGPNKFPHDIIYPKHIDDTREIVDNILASYVENRESLNNFRRFMYNILICSREPRIYLQDPTGIYAHICTGVVRGLNNEYLIRFCNEAWKNKECFNYAKYGRKMKKYGTRAICVLDNELITDDMIWLAHKIEIRYIVVITAKGATINSDCVHTYDEASKASSNRANEYFKSIRNKIIQIINEQVGCDNTRNDDPKSINIGDLFTRTDRLLYNFVQWCGGAYDE